MPLMNLEFRKYYSLKEKEIRTIHNWFHLDLKVQHLFPIQNQKRNRETLIETSRNRPVSRNQTAILAGTLKSKTVLDLYYAGKPQRRGENGY